MQTQISHLLVISQGEARWFGFVCQTFVLFLHKDEEGRSLTSGLDDLSAGAFQQLIKQAGKRERDCFEIPIP